MDARAQSAHSSVDDIPDALSTETKRQVLYASLLRFEPAMRSLREVALNRVVLAALIGSDDENPLRLGQIQKNLNFGSAEPKLRDDTVQATLNRLIDTGKAGKTTKLTRHAYFLTPQGGSEVGAAIESGAKLFDRVLHRLLRDIASAVPFETAAAVCRVFLCECFAKFGSYFAKVATGQWTKDDFSRAANLGAAFTVAVQGLEVDARGTGVVGDAVSRVPAQR